MVTRVTVVNQQRQISYNLWQYPSSFGAADTVYAWDCKMYRRMGYTGQIGWVDRLLLQKMLICDCFPPKYLVWLVTNRCYSLDARSFCCGSRANPEHKTKEIDE